MDEIKETKIEKKTKHQPIELKYKLNVYSPSGTLRHAISASVYQDMCIRYGDIMRAVSSTRWMTMEEISDSTWQIEKKMKNPANRTRKAIESAIGELVERTMILTRE
jgi:hypothetical protein